MMPKLSLSTVLSSSVIAGAVFLTAIAPSTACPFANRLEKYSTTATNPSDPTTRSINFDKFSTNKLGMAGAGFAALLGLYAGSKVVKSRLAKSQQPDVAPSVTELPVFPIEVPAAALAVADQAEAIEAEESAL